jgi:hypothetical protein
MHPGEHGPGRRLRAENVNSPRGQGPAGIRASDAQPPALTRPVSISVTVATASTGPIPA